jgi:adenylylsulfate kinase-like enzyme
MIGSDRFVEVLIDAPEEVTAARRAARPRKSSLAKRAKRALASVVARIAFRGHDAYDVPVAPDLRIDTTLRTPTEGAHAIFDLLLERGFVVPPGPERMEGTSEVASAL